MPGDSLVTRQESHRHRAQDNAPAFDTMACTLPPNFRLHDRTVQSPARAGDYVSLCLKHYQPSSGCNWMTNQRSEAMTGRMNWSKARKFKGTEEKYEPGKVMENGRAVYNGPRDTLEMKARAAQRTFGKKKPKPSERYKPTPYDLERAAKNKQ
jgi:hypothetical protein